MIRLLVILAIGPLRASAQPANDNFANRIPLQGNSLTFTGTLVGATTEQPFEIQPSSVQGSAPKSVWWSWTTSESNAVTLMVERINLSPDLTEPDSLPYEYLAVWNPPASFGFPTNAPCSGCVVASMPLFLADSPNMTFIATAGSTYQLQLRGMSTNNFRIRLVATNSPIIVEQPKCLAASPGASALLTVIAVGVRPFSYQWQFNGNALPGETFPMLALTNVSEADAGLYSVLVSNATGAVVSENASLTVNGEEAPSQLATLRG